jgi:signal transduction histidine kinase
MKWFAELNIYNKIIRVFILILALFSILVGLLMWNSLDTAMSEQFEKRGIEITKRIASSCIGYILVNDLISLHEVANEMRNSNNDIRYVLVTDHRGGLLAHTFSNGIPKGLLNINSRLNVSDYNIEKINTNEGLILDILVPIEGGKVGFTRVGIMEEYIRSLIKEKLRAIILITLLVCAVAAIMTTRLTAMLTKPIQDLVKATREIACGNLSSRVEVTTNDEIGELATDFNNMAESLIKINEDRNKLLEALQEKERMRDILLNKLITAQEDERKRVSRELHDETSQALTSLIVSMRLLADRETDSGKREMILGVRDVVADIIKGVRNLAVELRPPVLDDLGLVAAMEKYISKYQEHFRIAVDFTHNISHYHMDNQIILALYRIMQECLTNIVKHSGARNVRINLEGSGGHIVLVVSDDGKGIGNEALRRTKEENRIGIYGMQERAELFGGTFNMVSDNGGTTIKITIPTIEPAGRENKSYD